MSTIDDMVMAASVTTKGECAWICESLGEFRCQSFNVRLEGTKMRCEIFDHIPINGTRMAEKNAELYERRCEPLYVVASMKEKLKDNQTLVTLIDDKGAVYQVRSSDPTLQHICHYMTVFEGFTGRVDDIVLANVPPYGDVHFIRDGEWLYCFLATPETRQQFLPCEPREEFPISFFKISNDRKNSLPKWVTIDEFGTILSVHQSHVNILHTDVPESGNYDVLKPEWANHYTCPSPFCPCLALFEQSSSGLFNSSSEIGVFYEAKFYVYDFRAHQIVRRYSVCRGEDVLYIFGRL